MKFTFLRGLKTVLSSDYRGLGNLPYFGQGAKTALLLVILGGCDTWYLVFLGETPLLAVILTG